MARKKYDFVIIGGGLTGLIISHSLVQAGKKIALVESQDTLGGNLHFRSCSMGKLPDYLKNHSVSEECSENVNRFASKYIGSENPTHKHLVSTKIFDSGKFKDFVGFGNRAPQFVDIIQSYTNTEKLEFSSALSQSVESLIGELENSESCDIFVSSPLTDLIIEDEKVSLAELSSSKKLEAEEFIFTSSIHKLLELRNEDILCVKNKQKIAKATYWTSIHLEMLHETVDAPTENDYILMAGTDNAIPCYGSFGEPTNLNGKLESPVQISQWISFVESNLTNDMDLTGNLVREMKKQVKRAHGDIFDKKSFEKISVYPFSHGHVDLKLDNTHPKSAINLSILSRETDLHNSILGRINTAVSFLDEMDVQLSELKELNPSVNQPDNVDKSVETLETHLI